MHCLRIILAIMLCVFTTARAGAQESDRPDLRGTVVNASGQPVEGATVFVYTASVRTGYSTYCPSCYPDCAKQTTTDKAGAFTIESLDPELYFNLLTAADGYQPFFTKKTDPLAGPVRIEIKAQPGEPDDVRQVVRGRVVNVAGEPVVGAVVRPAMIRYPDGRGRGGRIDGLDPLAVTNREGRFEIRHTEPLVDMDLKAEARGLAARFFPKRVTGDEEHLLQLDIGATVSGRLVQDGRPLAGVQLGLVQVDRSSMNGWFGAQYIGTDDQGAFVFENVPIGFDWYLYGTMDSIRDYGAVEAKRLTVRGDGEVIDAGTVPVVEAFTLKGQVVLTDGRPLEPGMRLFISRQQAWDTQIVELPPDGRFEFFGLPRETYTIFASVRGYHLSADNPNLNGSIEGMIDQNHDDFIILLDPGAAESGPIWANKRDRPLRSAARPSNEADDSK